MRIITSWESSILGYGLSSILASPGPYKKQDGLTSKLSIMEVDSLETELERAGLVFGGEWDLKSEEWYVYILYQNVGAMLDS